MHVEYSQRTCAAAAAVFTVVAVAVVIDSKIATQGVIRAGKAAGEGRGWDWGRKRRCDEDGGRNRDCSMIH